MMGVIARRRIAAAVTAGGEVRNRFGYRLSCHWTEARRTKKPQPCASARWGHHSRSELPLTSNYSLNLILMPQEVKSIFPSELHFVRRLAVGVPRHDSAPNLRDGTRARWRRLQGWSVARPARCAAALISSLRRAAITLGANIDLTAPGLARLPALTKRIPVR
jgi:hypothetical protein